MMSAQKAARSKILKLVTSTQTQLSSAVNGKQPTEGAGDRKIPTVLELLLSAGVMERS